jgi:hypothetical protein
MITGVGLAGVLELRMSALGVVAAMAAYVVERLRHGPRTAGLPTLLAPTLLLMTYLAFGDLMISGAKSLVEVAGAVSARVELALDVAKASWFLVAFVAGTATMRRGWGQALRVAALASRRGALAAIDQVDNG